MVKPEDAIQIIHLLESNDIPVWLVGGWGIDSMLGRQTREHKDLDILLQRDDLQKAKHLLENVGYSLKEIWSENNPVFDFHGNQIDTAFVLQDASSREIDLHAFHLEGGQVIPDWEDSEGHQITKAQLDHQGMINGISVRCISQQLQFLFHAGYDLPDYQIQDIRLLNEKYP
jgi:lincosamide nucleotidyltransferase A/C/D/E